MLAEPAAVDLASGCVLLDEGESRLAAADYARAVRAIATKEAIAVESGRNSTCFRVRLDTGDRDGNGDDNVEYVAVKVPRLGPQRTNDDATFALEAGILARLPGAGIANAPQLLARVAADGGHFLFTTWLAGAHPDPAARPLSERHVSSILADCTAMDRQGLMHYDLKATNILVDGQAVAFVDFEFARFDGLLDAFAPTRATYCDDYNVCGNPHFPGRTNVANFEFRTLYRYCEDLAAARSQVPSRAFFRRYLQLRAEHHAQMADFFVELQCTSAEALAAGGGLTTREATRRLADAANHERLLARLLRDPATAVVEIEWALLALRHDMFERPGADVLRRVGDLNDRLHGEVARDDRVPTAYLHAALWTADCIGRSRMNIVTINR